MEMKARIGYAKRKTSPVLRKCGATLPAPGLQNDTRGIDVSKKHAKQPKRIQEDKNYIEVMGKIFKVLEYFIENSSKQKSVAFSEISKELPFARTTTHRILYSLEKLGYLEKDEEKSHYRLAVKFFELTGPAVHFRRLQAVAKTVMQNLLSQFGETVNLGSWTTAKLPTSKCCKVRAHCASRQSPASAIPCIARLWGKPFSPTCPKARYWRFLTKIP